MSPWISVCIATYNSESQIESLIQNIKNQHKPIGKLELEILIVDGGSSDKTIEIANNLGCKIILNQKGDAINAKHLAFFEAKSDLICFLDHDERFINQSSLLLKYNEFELYPDDLAIFFTSGYLYQISDSTSNLYGSEFGDPVNFFFHKTSSMHPNRIKSFEKNLIQIKNSSENTIFSTEILDKPILAEAVAAGTVVNRKVFVKNFSNEIINPYSIPHLFYFLFKDAPFLVGVSKNDPLLHNSSENWKKILYKIRWRVENQWDNEIDGIKKAGITGRRELITKNRNTFTRIKDRSSQFFFPLYALSPVVIFDALRLVISRKKIGYLMHIFLSYYVIYRSFVEIMKSFKIIKSRSFRYDGTALMDDKR